MNGTAIVIIAMALAGCSQSSYHPVLAASRGEVEAKVSGNPTPAPHREPFNESLVRSKVENEMARESYRSIGRPYGCKDDCSRHDAGFKYRAQQGYGGPIVGDARSFRQGQRAYDDEVDRRVEEAREQYRKELE